MGFEPNTIVLRALESVVGSEHVLAGNDLERYRLSPNLFRPLDPELAVRPGTEEEVCAILRLAQEQGVRLQVRGLGRATGGFTTPLRDVVVLDVSRLDRVLELNADEQTIRVQCGISVGVLDTVARDAGFRVDTVEEPQTNGASLGGVLSGMVGGGDSRSAAAHGFSGRSVLALDVALPSGRILQTGAGGASRFRTSEFARGAGGPDLVGLFIGDAGYFGVKLQATLQLYPQATQYAYSSWSFTSFESMHGALLALTSLEPAPYSRLHATDDGQTYRIHSFTEAPRQDLVESLSTTAQAVVTRSGGTQEQGGDRIAERFYRGDDVGDPAERGFSVSVYSAKTVLPDARRIVSAAMEEAIIAAGYGDSVRLSRSYRPIARNTIHTMFRLGWTELEADPETRHLAVLRAAERGYHVAVEAGCTPASHHAVTGPVAAGGWAPEYREFVETLKRALDTGDVLNHLAWGTDRVASGS